MLLLAYFKLKGLFQDDNIENNYLLLQHAIPLAEPVFL